MPDSNDGIPESIIKLLPPDATPHAIPRVIGFIGAEILFKVLSPFIEKCLKVKRGHNWQDYVIARFNEHGKEDNKEGKKGKKGKKSKKSGEIKWDLLRLLRTTVVCREDFRETFKIEEQHNELIEALRIRRNKIMHNDPLTHKDADSALDNMIDLIRAMNEGEDAVEKLTTLRQWIGTPKRADQLSKKEKDAEYYFNQGIVNFYENKYREAIENYDKAIKIDPNDANAYNNRGIAKVLLGGNNKGAIKDYDKAIEIDPKSTYAYNNRGNAKVLLKDFKEAIKDYDKAIELDPNNAETYTNRGKAKGLKGDYQKVIEDYTQAIEDFDKAIDINSEYADAYTGRGNAKSKLGKNQEAIEDWTEAIRLDPNSAEAYNNIGAAKGRQGDYIQAIENFDKAININSEYANAYNNRGIAKRSLGDEQGALEDFEIAENLRKKE